MKKLFFVFFLILQTGFLFAHERPVMAERQRQQENAIENAYQKGQLTENEYDKLMKEQKHIKDAIETNDLDNHWSMLEHNTMIDKMNNAEKRINKYVRNTERF